MCEVKLPIEHEVEYEHLRLLPAGHLQKPSGGGFLTRSTWGVSRCWSEDGVLVCAVRASLRGRVYTAVVPEAHVRTVETSETGVVVQLQRAVSPGR
ncbi:MAG: hypothetical protein KC432_04695 [Thermomicrobiales bacterium]|nr:hypothetical protein [Thermomicrobiales bacterium]